jgi:cell division protease FtsH
MKGVFGWFLFIVLAVMLFMLTNKNRANYAPIPLSDFVSRLESGKVQRVVIATDELLGEFASPETVDGDKIAKFRVTLPIGTTGNWTFQQWLVEHRQNARVEVDNNPNWFMQILLPLAPWLLIFVFIWFFVFRQLRNQMRQQQTNKIGDALKVYVVNQAGAPPLPKEPPPPSSPPTSPPR